MKRKLKPITQINPDGKLSHLVAVNLFEDKTREVFCARTGRWIGCLQQGGDVLSLDFSSPEVEAQAEIIPVNPLQQSLF